jgi:hypothetical protein
MIRMFRCNLTNECGRTDGTWPEEHGEAEVDGLERRLLVVADEEEVLRLEVPVHDPERVARLHDGDDDAGQLPGLPLRVVAPPHDAVEQLPARAELHDHVHGDGVLERAADGDDVGVPRQVVHDLDLAPDVLHVLVGDQLPLGDGLARVLQPRRLVHAQVRGAELPLPELPPQAVLVLEVVGLAPEHRLHLQPRAGDALDVRRFLPGLLPRRRLLLLLRLRRLLRRRRRW